MDAVKLEHEVDPLATDTSYNNNPLYSYKEGILLHLLSTKVKGECEDHSYDLTSEVKLEAEAVPINSAMVKCETEEECCDMDTVKEDLLLETTQESEVMVDRRDNWHCCVFEFHP
ncbi:uncharacterized protein [Periplaneta americana]|uniref:uncharacterized protein isoform X3 n=1 Tax=Periplaneta americana TaxID=6978 RepID=UPI0037E91F7F